MVKPVPAGIQNNVNAPAARFGLSKNRRVLLFFLSSFLITAAIICWMQSLSSGYFESHDVTVFYYLFIFQDNLPAFVALALLAAALIPDFGALGMRLASFCGSRPMAVASITTVCLCVGSIFVYRNYPLCMDEYAAVFQSKVFAAGRLAGQFPTPLIDWLIPPVFQNNFLTVSHQSGEIVSSYWPGFAILLTPFTWVSAPWAANAILGGITVLLVHRLTFRLMGSHEAAGFAVLLTLASPVVTINAISYYSMPAHLVANMAFALLLLNPTPWRSFTAGVLGSFALVLHNPVPHTLFAIPWILWLLYRRELRKNVIFMIAGYLPLSAILGLGWQLFLHGLNASGAISFSNGASEASFIDHLFMTLRLVLVQPSTDQLFARLIGLAKVWIWAVPGLLLLACRGALKERGNIRFMLITASAFCTLAGYMFVSFDQGHGWGFRYFHSAWFALPLLATAAVYGINEPGMTQLRKFVAGLAVLSLVFLTATNTMNVRQFIDRHLQQLPGAEQVAPQVLIVNPGFGFYTIDLVQNDPFLRKRPIILVSHGESADQELMRKHFPELRQISAGLSGSAWSDLSR